MTRNLAWGGKLNKTSVQGFERGFAADARFFGNQDLCGPAGVNFSDSHTSVARFETTTYLWVGLRVFFGNSLDHTRSRFSWQDGLL